MCLTKQSWRVGVGLVQCDEFATTFVATTVCIAALWRRSRMLGDRLCAAGRTFLWRHGMG